MRKYCSCIIAPAAVMGIMLTLYACYSIYPFGDRTIAWCDMNQQVIPFLMDFKDILSGKTNLFLNLQNAGGMSFWGVFLFFISSPFTLLVLLVSKQEIYHLVNILVLLKMMTCGFTASIFFRRRLGTLNWLQNASLSLMYAFSGYAMFYYQNHVWLDMMYLFPVLLIGLLNLAETGKPRLYILTFSAIMAVNFYLSYMVSVFLVLAAGLYLAFCTPKQTRGKVLLLFGASTFLVMLLTAVIWIPSLYQYLASARSGSLLNKLRGGNLYSQWETNASVILATGALITALILYFQSLGKSHNRKTDFLFCMILLTLIPVFIDPINKMWHTGSYQAFPVRYGYIPIFFSLILYGILLAQPRTFKSGTRIPLFLGIFSVFGVAWLAFYFIDQKYRTLTVYTRSLWCSRSEFYLVLIFSAAAAISYYFIASLCRRNRNYEKIGSVLLCLTVFIECVFNTTVYMVSPISNASSYSLITDLAERIQDDDLYRVKTKQKYFEVNLIGALGYNSLSHYTSLTNQNFLYLMKKLGYSSYWMEVSSNGGTELSDALLGNRYTIVHSGNGEESSRIIYQNDRYAIEQNPTGLPVGVLIPDLNPAAVQKLPQASRVGIQEFLFESIFQAKEQLFTECVPTKLDNVSITKNKIIRPNSAHPGYITYSIPVSDKTTLYFDCFYKLSNKLVEPINSSLSISVNEKVVEFDYPSQNNNAILNLGTFQNQNVDIEVEVKKDISVSSFGLSAMKNSVFQRAIHSLQSASLRQQGNSIMGTAKANSDGEYLFLPINYDAGYTAYVNDQKVPIEPVFDSMMAIKLKKGENTVSIRYIPQGFLAGMWISVIGGIACVLAARFKTQLLQKARAIEYPIQIVFSLVFACVFFMIYIFPLLVFYKK